MKTRFEIEVVSKLEISYNCKTMMMALCVKGEQTYLVKMPNCLVQGPVPERRNKLYQV